MIIFRAMIVNDVSSSANKVIFDFSPLIVEIILLLFIFRQLSPVTQLYVSVDASTKASLKKIDRPLFSDFWERFIDSLKALSEKVKF